MSEWFSKPLSQLVSFQKGRKVETSEHPRDGFAPYLGASAISGTIEEYADARFGVTAAAGDVLMLWDGERSGLVGKAQDGVIASTVARLSTKGEIEGAFLYYALDENFEWIQNRRTGTGVPHVPKDLGRILSVPFPLDKNEQRRIAEILSTLDETIEQTEALIAKYRQIKAGLMHDLFTRGVTPDGRLRPTRAQAPHLYRESPIGWIPKEWDLRPLVSFATSQPGGFVNGPFGSDLLTRELTDSGVPVIYVQDIKEDEYRRGSNAHVTEEKANKLLVCNVRAGDVLVAKVGDPPGITASYSEDQRAVVTQDVIRIRPTNDVVTQFLAGLLNSPVGSRAIQKIIIEGTRARVSLTEFKCLVLPKPTREEQQSIASRISAVQRVLSSFTTELGKLKTQKHGLMHDLLTGRVRVKVAG